MKAPGRILPFGGGKGVRSGLGKGGGGNVGWRFSPAMPHSRAIFELFPNLVFVDLEVRAGGEIGRAGVWGRDWEMERSGAEVAGLAEELDGRLGEDALLGGHNLLDHDLPILREQFPGLRRIGQAPALDSLFLSPVAFPKKPYHALVKDKLLASESNRPLSDCRASAAVLADAVAVLAGALARGDEGPRFLFACLTGEGLPAGGALGVARLAAALGVRPPDFGSAEGWEMVRRMGEGRVCLNHLRARWEQAREQPAWRVALAFAAAWWPVAGGDSIVPPWVGKRFPEVDETIESLRRRTCGEASCAYCAATHQPVGQLRRWFGFERFRPTPELPGQPGRSLQEAVVAAGMNGESVLAVLPTGGGKSLCFQLPALYGYACTGALTVVVSPLQALMKDQVENLKRRSGVFCTEALYGLLTLAERRVILDELALGSIGLLYVSPEQLRSASFRKALLPRKIDRWVYDEAHCLSKWGHDFRPDYFYVARFIRELAAEQGAGRPAVGCFTATAKREVREEIAQHLAEELGLTLRVFDGGAERDNLRYRVEDTGEEAKVRRMDEILAETLGRERPEGSAVIFCATRQRTEQIRSTLQRFGWDAGFFHAGLEADAKKEAFDRFMSGTTRVMVATNAFGMGVDKPDVRVVIHADVPGSLENYLQEAGRAGRDGRPADCVLLFNEKDLERQFRLGGRTQLGWEEVQEIWRAIRRLDRRKAGEVILTVHEILGRLGGLDDPDGWRDKKMVTAVALLEKQGFLQRGDNRPIVFQGRALVRTLEEGRERIARLGLPPVTRALWEAYLEVFLRIEGDAAYGLEQFVELPQTDAAMRMREKAADRRPSPFQFAIGVLNEMSAPGVGLLRKGVRFSAWVAAGGRHHAGRRRQALAAAEEAFLGLLRETAPDAQGWARLNLPAVNQALAGREVHCAEDTLAGFLRQWESDPRQWHGDSPNVEIRPTGQGQFALRLLSDWQKVAEGMRARHQYLAVLVDLLLAKAGEGRGEGEKEAHVEFSEHEVVEAFQADLGLRTRPLRRPGEALLVLLTFAQRNGVIQLQNGKALIVSAMTLRLNPDKIRRPRALSFTKGDFSAMAAYYGERILQIHIVAAYARTTGGKLVAHLRLLADYFRLGKTEFARRYLPENPELYRMATGIESYRRIVDELRHPGQQALVAAAESGNRIVLAGPGSGKTRVIVHRCAFLLRVRRVPPRSLLVLCFNRNACLELRRRIYRLVEQDAHGVIISTYHALALRLLGRSLADLAGRAAEKAPDFKAILREATAWLRDERSVVGVPSGDLRRHLLGEIRHVLIDEYQDIDQDEYDFIRALSGAGLDEDQHRQPTLLAVGDDDQAIYGFKGAHVRYIRRFREEYAALEDQLLENYRSSAPIVRAANQLIGRNRERLKSAPIRVDRARQTAPAGGRWERLDPLLRGQVCRLTVANPVEQALAIVGEVERRRALDQTIDWRQFAVLARANRDLLPVRALLEERRLPVSFDPAAEQGPSPWRVREIAGWLRLLEDRADEEWSAVRLREALGGHVGEVDNPWTNLLDEVAREWQGDQGERSAPVPEIRAFYLDAILDRRRQRALANGVVLSTIHRAKGLEFAHVFVLDGAWPERHRRPPPDSLEEERRIYYVGMTRAAETLTLLQRRDLASILPDEIEGEGILHRSAPPAPAGTVADWAHRQYTLLTPESIYLSYAGRHPPTDPLHQRLARLAEGSRLQLREGHGLPLLCDESGAPVASLSQSGRQLVSGLGRIRTIRVLAMLERRRDDQAAEYADQVRCDRWEYPFGEIVHDDPPPAASPPADEDRTPSP